MKILAGDIGGTNARLTVYDVELTRYETLIAETFPSREYATLEEIVAGFMGSHGIECQRRARPGQGRPGADDEPAVAGRDLGAGRRRPG